MSKMPFHTNPVMFCRSNRRIEMEKWKQHNIMYYYIHIDVLLGLVLHMFMFMVCCIRYCIIPLAAIVRSQFRNYIIYGPNGCNANVCFVNVSKYTICLCGEQPSLRALLGACERDRWHTRTTSVTKLGRAKFNAVLTFTLTIAHAMPNKMLLQMEM